MQLVHRTTTSILPVRSCLQPRRPVHRLLVRAQTPQQRSETGSDASTSGTGSNNNNDGNKRNPLRALLERLPKGLPQTVLAFRDSVGQQINSTPKAIWILVGFLAIAAGRNIFFGGQRPAPREVLYSDFVTLLDVGKVRAARLEAGTGRLFFQLTPQEIQTSASAGALQVPGSSCTGSAASTSTSLAASSEAFTTSTQAAATTAAARLPFVRQFYIKLADKSDPVLMARIMQSSVEYSIFKASLGTTLVNAFVGALTIWIPLLPLFYFMRRALETRQGTQRSKKSAVTTPTTTFADVAGVDAAKAELVEIVAIMKGVKRTFSSNGTVSATALASGNTSTIDLPFAGNSLSGASGGLRVKVPSGVLLCGPPGTGKTLLAKAVAGEAGLPFLAVSASEFVELFVGRGAARIRELFAEARRLAPCVVFIDELDAVGSKRGMGFNDERDQTLNQLLTELDGFEGRPGVLFMGATNRIDVLDPALLRPGRISRKVVVPLPDVEGRQQIMRVHLKDVPMASDQEKSDACTRIAMLTQNFSGAELSNVAQEAVVLATRRDGERVELPDLVEAVQRTRFGVNGRSGGNAYGGGLAWKLQQWLGDSMVAQDAAERQKRQVKVGTGGGG